MAKLVSATYGDALFELALENDSIDNLYEEVKGVRQVFLENNELVKLLNHPKIDKDDKIQVMENVFKGRISDDLTGFLILTVKKDRYNDIVSILDYFVAKVKEYKKIGVVYVTTAVQLTQSKKDDVEKRLLETTSYTKFEMNYTVDAGLIGGMVIRIGDRIVDSSIKSKLDAMSRELLKIQLA